MLFEASQHARFSAVFLLLVAAAACNRKPQKPDQYSYSVFVDESVGTVKSVQLDGKPLPAPRQHAKGKSFDVTIPSSEYATEKSFTITLNTTCGAEQLPAKIGVGIARSSDRSGEDRVREDTKPGNVIPSELKFEVPQEARVFLDTDGAEGMTVEVGTTKLEGEKSHHDLALGNCASAREVKIDGKLVGELNTKSHTATGASGKDFEIPATTLVDVRGKHCYETILHIYRDKEADTTNAVRATPQRLEGSRVYAQDIDDFLKSSPDEFKSAELVVSRNELRRCPTKRAGRQR